MDSAFGLIGRGLVPVAGAGANVPGTTLGGVTRHRDLLGLDADDHPNYAYLPGRLGGQTLFGSRTSGAVTPNWVDTAQTFVQVALRQVATTVWSGIAIVTAAPPGRIILLSLATHEVNPGSTPTGNSSNHLTITDTQGNTWVKLREYTANMLAAADVVTNSLWYCIVSTGLTTSDTLTATYAISIPCQAIESRQFTSGVATPAITIAGTAADRFDEDADPGTQTISGLTSGDYLFVRGIAIHGSPGGADINLYTVSSGFTAFITPHNNSTLQTESADRQIGARGEFLISTATGAITDPSVDAATFPDSGSTFLALKIAGTVTGDLALQSIDATEAALVHLEDQTVRVSGAGDTLGRMVRFDNTSGSILSYIRASDGAFVGPIVASGTDTHPDNIFRIVGSSDATKKVAFEVDGLTTATTRTITTPDWDGTVALFRSDKLRIGDTAAPVHRLELVAGSTSVAPLLFTSGSLLITPVAGTVEFLTNLLYYTNTTGPTRKIIMAKINSTNFFINRVPFSAATGSDFNDSASLTYNDGTKAFNVIGSVTASGASAFITSQGELSALEAVNFGNQAKDSVSKVQVDYQDSSTGTVNVAGIGGILRATPGSASTTNFHGFDGGVRLENAGNITQSGVGLGAVGLRGTIIANNNATTTSATALNGLIYTENGTPILTNAYAMASRWVHNFGTIVNAYGFYVSNPALSGGAVLTNNYGVYIEAPTAGATLNWSILSLGGPNALGGKLRVGDTTAPVHLLELAAGTVTVAPLKLSAGTNLTTPIAGVVEYDGTTFFITPVGTTRQAVPIMKQTEVDFGSTPVESASFVVVDTAVTTAMHITGQVAYEAPTGKDLDELEMDSLECLFAPGAGQLTIFIRGREGYIADKFKINYVLG